jgi:predicted polyphosphate/ATP-dependent NAD kinase
MGDAVVGVVANPLSGRDIRRLVTQASVFPTAEKANMIQRMLTAFGAVGVHRVLLRTCLCLCLWRPVEVQTAIEDTIARAG